VKLYHQNKYEPEARVLAHWLKVRLVKCGLPVTCETVVTQSAAKGIDDFAVEFDYDNGHSFKWRADIAANQAEFAADLGQGRVELTTAVRLLDPPAALAEAIFF
jgi:hypothetical protein